MFVAELPLYAASLAAPAEDARKPIVWRDPGDIHSKDLFYGVGGKEDAPQGPFKYVQEDTGATSPKFIVTDAQGEKWKAKLGLESQAETVASRLLWAVGYSANENYYIAETHIPGVEHQKRGRKEIGPGDTARGVRLQRNPPHEKKTADWAWAKNPVKGTREFNGLRVMMALLSNWDLKTNNNAIYEDKDDPAIQIYGVSDVGASFGATSKKRNDKLSKNNLKAYTHSKFIKKVTEKEVDFNFPTRPSLSHYLLFEFPFVKQEQQHMWVGRHIPREDVRWIAGLLGQLSHEQIRDAFRSANYDGDKLEGFTAAVERRIAELKKL
jgi:hypothetical protein